MSIFDVEARKMAEEAAERERVNEQKAALNNVLAHKTLDELERSLTHTQRHSRNLFPTRPASQPQNAHDAAIHNRIGVRRN